MRSQDRVKHQNLHYMEHGTGLFHFDIEIRFSSFLAFSTPILTQLNFRAAWPTGPSDMSTFTDASYFDTLNGKPFMMGVSPWFYTNMPGFRKNWLWRGDSLWFDRWINVLYLQPEYVQIITWNGKYFTSISNDILTAERLW